MTPIRFFRIGGFAGAFLDAFICAVHKLPELLKKISDMWVNFRYPHAAKFDAQNPSEYIQIPNWIYENVPNYKKQVWIRVSSQSITITSLGITIEKTYSGEIRFKNKEHAVAFMLRFGD